MNMINYLKVLITNKIVQKEKKYTKF